MCALTGLSQSLHHEVGEHIPPVKDYQVHFFEQAVACLISPNGRLILFSDRLFGAVGAESALHVFLSGCMPGPPLLLIQGQKQTVLDFLTNGWI